LAEELASKIIEPGGSVVQAASDDSNLSAYAVLESNGHLELMVINKSATSALTGQFQLANYQPSATAQVWQYGEVQDTAQSLTSDGQSALANFSTTLTLSGSNFSYSFPAYSMTVLDVSPGSVNTGPTIVNAAAAPNPVTGTTTVLSVSATDPTGASGLTYTWTTTGTSPGGVGFSVNGTNAASSTMATVRVAGTYTFQVTVADLSGMTATSLVRVTVNQSLTTITVSPSSAFIKAGGTQQFTAVAGDQFGDPLATQPDLTWSVTSGGGTIDAAGLYTAGAQGTAQVQAAAGGSSGSASVLVLGSVITPPPTSGPGATVHFTHRSHKGTGFVGDVTITNTGPTAIDGWILQFTLTTSLASISSATIVRHKGTRYTIQNTPGDASIAPGGSVSILLRRARGRSFAAPTRYVLNGVPLGGKG
jgi:hypothetical protein